MSYQRFARGNRRDYERYAHERDDPESRRPKPERREADVLDANRLSRDARRTMESYPSLRPDEPNAEYRYQYQYEQASYMEIYSHSSGQGSPSTAAQHVADWRLQPLSLTVGSEIARQFHWKAETGTIYTYEHDLTSRFLHLDRITRQFCDQKRNPLSTDRALAHAMPQPDEVFATDPAIVEAQVSQVTQAAPPLPVPALPAPTFAGPGPAFTGQALVGQWKTASEVGERNELSVGSFVRRADMEAQESHERLTASAMKFVQQELPPGTRALVRIYRKLTMKASQVRAEEPTIRRGQAPLMEGVLVPAAQLAPVQAPPVQAAQLYAGSAPMPAARPIQQAGERRELNVAAFTRRAA